MSHAPNRPLRVLFYLPVITAWWFENIVFHLIDTLAKEHEVHAIVTPTWQGTGLSIEQAPSIERLSHIHWHVFNGPDHPILRSDASSNEELIAFIRAIGPDLTLCRSADIKTPALFPGEVRYIMEGGAPPLETCSSWISLSSSLFDHGIIPALSADQKAALDQLAVRMVEPLLKPSAMPSRETVFNAAGLSPTRPTIALPLEYEHEENCFRQHLHFSDNAGLIREVASRVPAGTQLMVTDHPLNALYCDMSAVEEAIAGFDGRVGLLRQETITRPPTLAAAHCCDAMVVQNTKSWSLGAAFGTPMLRLSNFATADWLGAYHDWPPFLDAFMRGALRTADPKAACGWFAFHMANDVFDPASADVTASEIIDRAFVPVSPSRWQAGLERLAHFSSEAA